MTYYEELGISTGATREEIRHAYKHLARLVHPDHCGDKETRRLADVQLKRLNAMVETLLDPAGRERYDRSLIAMAAAVAVKPVRARLARVGWRQLAAAAIAIGAASLILALGASPARPRLPMEYAPPPAEAIALTSAAPKTSSKIVHAANARQAPVEDDWEPLATYAYESHFSIPTVPFPDTQIGPALPAPVEKPAPPREATGLSGDWLYVSKSSGVATGYPPEYVELRLRMESGLIHGRYQARYRVTDKAISPNVSFQFEGRIADSGGSVPWHGPGGAEGQVKLRLLADRNLQVTWEAETLGDELGLISGTAILVRRVE
jgi:curved DNA-binding protein CbpA